PVLVISDRFWRTRLGGDAGVIGQPLSVGGDAVPVIGVLQPSATDMPWSADVYAALGPQAADPSFASRGNHPGLAVLARIKPGVSRTQAGVDLNTVMRRLAAAYPVSNRGETATAVPLDQYLNGAYRSELWLLLGAVGLVLLLACANLAQL